MDKKFIGILVVFIILFASLGLISAEEDNNAYQMTMGIVNLTIGENGLLHVSETYTYQFDGTFHGVYRDIPIKNGQSINNIKINTTNAYSNYEVLDKDSNTKRIKIYLYKNSAKTEPIENRDVNVTVSYDFTNAIKIYNDTGELQYQIWGTQWTKPIHNFTANINYPSKNGVKYWINPYKYSKLPGKWNGSTLTIHSNYLDTNSYLELRTTIPLNEFSSNTPYAIHINKDGLKTIEKIQNDYENKNKTEDKAFSIISIIEIILIFVPFGIYYAYGREPKISYNGIYEREPPTNDSPAFVNGVFVSGIKKEIGKINDDAFKATIMDLINKGYLSIETNEKNFLKSLNIKITDKDQSELKDYEKQAINVISVFENDGVIDFSNIANSMSNEKNWNLYNSKYSTWKNDFTNKYISKSILKQYFNNNGALFMRISGVINLIIGILFTLISFTSDGLSNGPFLMKVSIILIVASIITLLLPQTIGGQWTSKGKEEYEKWKNFKKYLTDFSLIKEYPPESIAIWNKYLVYATALGVAKEVQKAMKNIEYLDNENIEMYNNDLFLFTYYGGLNMLDDAIITGRYNPDINNIGDLGDFGDIGGGFGGGGGGAF